MENISLNVWSWHHVSSIIHAGNSLRGLLLQVHWHNLHTAGAIAAEWYEKLQVFNFSRSYYIHSVHTWSLYVESQYNFAYKWWIRCFQCDYSIEVQSVQLIIWEFCKPNQTNPTNQPNINTPHKTNKQPLPHVITLQYYTAIKNLY